MSRLKRKAECWEQQIESQMKIRWGAARAHIGELSAFLLASWKDPALLA